MNHELLEYVERLSELVLALIAAGQPRYQCCPFQPACHSCSDTTNFNPARAAIVLLALHFLQGR